jgi:hypothetical protein
MTTERIALLADRYIGRNGEQPAIRMSIQRMACTACGAEANASCNCGQPYVPASQRINDYDKQNPGRSTRQAAADLGVSKSEVDRARKASPVPDGTPDKVVGMDGKTYPAKLSKAAAKAAAVALLDDIASKASKLESVSADEVEASDDEDPGGFVVAVVKNATEKADIAARNLQYVSTESDKAKIVTAIDALLRKWKSVQRKSAAEAEKAAHDDDRIPTDKEAEESWQNDLYEQACLLWEQMTPATRQRFMATWGVKPIEDEPDDTPDYDDEDTTADGIAGALIEMEDQKKLRKVASFVNDHLSHPERNHFQRMIALGHLKACDVNGPLGKKAAMAKYADDSPAPSHSWYVEATDDKGARWRSGVRLGSEEEAKVYVEAYARHKVPGYATASILRSDDAPNRQHYPEP